MGGETPKEPCRPSKKKQAVRGLGEESALESHDVEKRLPPQGECEFVDQSLLVQKKKKNLGPKLDGLSGGDA
ncbi:hypothetical protein SUGI_0880390 [Cryptomeria japonica]|nr:hypothetical protein SUGI_0880390 [Cryptomeria japonica]